MMDNMSSERGVMLCALETPHVVIPDQYQSIYGGAGGDRHERLLVGGNCGSVLSGVHRWLKNAERQATAGQEVVGLAGEVQVMGFRRATGEGSKVELVLRATLQCWA